MERSPSARHHPPGLQVQTKGPGFFASPIPATGIHQGWLVPVVPEPRKVHTRSDFHFRMARAQWEVSLQAGRGFNMGFTCPMCRAAALAKWSALTACDPASATTLSTLQP
eukprot:5423699-Amphidinium_carterae.1